MDDQIPDFRKAEYGVQPPPPAMIEAYGAGYVESSQFSRSLFYGFGAALIGSLLYALVGHWIHIGFVAIIVGGIIGTAMMRATDGIGGRRYQIASVLLTYFAVALAFSLELLWEMMQAGKDLRTWIPAHLILLAVITVIGPFLELSHPVSGAIDLLILFFGMQAAWRVTKGGQDFSQFNKPDAGTTLGLR